MVKPVLKMPGLSAQSLNMACCFQDLLRNSTRGRKMQGSTPTACAAMRRTRAELDARFFYLLQIGEHYNMGSF